MKKLIFNSEEVCFQIVTNGEHVSTPHVVLFDGESLQKEIKIKPIHKVILENIVIALQKIPNKEISMTIPMVIDCINKYDFVFSDYLSNTNTAIETPKMLSNRKQFLFDKIRNTNTSVRLSNCLRSAEMTYWFEVIRKRQNDILKIRNFGKKSLTEIVDIFSENNIVSSDGWNMIADLSITFNPEEHVCSSIDMIVKTKEWEELCTILSVVEIKNPNLFKIKDFILRDESGYCYGETYNMLYFDGKNPYARYITEKEKQEKLKSLVEKIRELAEEYYMRQARIYVESLPLD